MSKPRTPDVMPRAAVSLLETRKKKRAMSGSFPQQISLRVPMSAGIRQGSHLLDRQHA